MTPSLRIVRFHVDLSMNEFDDQLGQTNTKQNATEEAEKNETALPLSPMCPSCAHHDTRLTLALGNPDDPDGAMILKQQMQYMIYSCALLTMEFNGMKT